MKNPSKEFPWIGFWNIGWIVAGVIIGCLAGTAGNAGFNL